MLDAVAQKQITDDILNKSKKCKEVRRAFQGSIEERVSGLRYLEQFLDANNFIRIYEVQEFGSQIDAEYFIESSIPNIGAAYIFFRKRTENDNYVVVSFFRKKQTYRGSNLYWRLKEKISSTETKVLYKSTNYREVEVQI